MCWTNPTIESILIILPSPNSCVLSKVLWPTNLSITLSYPMKNVALKQKTIESVRTKSQKTNNNYHLHRHKSCCVKEDHQTSLERECLMHKLKT